MPSAIIHRAVAKNVLNKTKMFSNEHDSYIYEIGSIAPDSWRNTKKYKDSTLPKIEKRQSSHFSNSGSYLENYNLFLDKYKDYLNNPFMLGYFVHLLTDYIAHQTSVYKSIFKLEEQTLSKEKDNAINYILHKKLNLKELRLLTDEEINSFPKMDELEYDGINATIKYTNNELRTSINEKIQIDGIENFLEEIDNWSNTIINEINKYKKD